MFRHTVWVAGSLILAVTPIDAQFGGLADRAKRKAQEAVTDGRRTEAPRRTSGRNERPSAAQGSSQRPSDNQTASESSANDAVWPGLVLDEALVKTQQAEARKHCEEKTNRGTSRIDCECVANQFPEWRLRSLSAQIRIAKMRLDSQCAKDQAAPECARERQILEWLLNKDSQDMRKPPPFATGPATPQRLKMSIESLYNRLMTAQAGQCVNPVPWAERQEKNCLETPTHLSPGTSTAAYCGCVKRESIRLFQERKLPMSSGAESNIAGEASRQCQQESR